MSRLSLAQQLAQIDDAAPVDYDPEALETYVEGDEPEEGDAQAAREHYIDVGPSELRKQHDSLADPRYQGVRTSRKALLDADNAEGSEPEDDSEEGDEFRGVGDESPAASSEDDEHEWSTHPGDNDQDSEVEEDDDEDEEMAPPAPRTAKRSAEEEGEEGPTEDLSSTLKQARAADLQKGKAVAKQQALWDALLDSRIQIQKAVVAANKLPSPQAVPSFFDDPECTEALLKLSQEALALADDLSELQEKLFHNNENVSPPARKRRKLEQPPDLTAAAEDLISACESAAMLEETYHSQLVQTLTKWSAKIQAVAPSVLLPSNRGAFSKGKHQTKSAVQLVDDSLQDHAGLLARTRLRRAPGARIQPATEQGDEGAVPGGGDDVAVDAAAAEVDPEIFDDTDFYQKMLRDLIDSRGGGDGKDADWLAIQKQKKAKKVVDTRASKGRKIRYQVHEKIQNFMVPVPAASGWHDEQIDELFSSLLGKGFEDAVGLGEKADTNARTDEGTAAVVQGGFRIFG